MTLYTAADFLYTYNMRDIDVRMLIPSVVVAVVLLSYVHGRVLINALCCVKVRIFIAK